VYGYLKILVGIAFNIFNLLLGGNLPPLGAASVIVEREGSFLIVETSGGRWSFPGGFMRWREQPAESARRECFEETGLHIRTRGVIGHYSTVSDRFSKMSTFTVVYHGEVEGGELRASAEGRPRWIAREELLSRLGEEHQVFTDYERYRAGHSTIPVSTP
jgi:ADP-ribose pyrophosphatase YjhB (NUDIX family)